MLLFFSHNSPKKEDLSVCCVQPYGMYRCISKKGDCLFKYSCGCHCKTSSNVVHDGKWEGLGVGKERGCMRQRGFQDSNIGTEAVDTKRIQGRYITDQ